MSGITNFIAGAPNRVKRLTHMAWRDQGFMLIECLVALAIAATAVVVVLQVAEASINRHSHSMAVRNAHLEAESLLRSATGIPDSELTEVPLSAGRIAILKSTPFVPKGAIAAKLANDAGLLVLHVQVYDKKGRLLATMQTLKTAQDDR